MTYLILAAGVKYLYDFVRYKVFKVVLRALSGSWTGFGYRTTAT